VLTQGLNTQCMSVIQKTWPSHVHKAILLQSRACCKSSAHDCCEIGKKSSTHDSKIGSQSSVQDPKIVKQSSTHNFKPGRKSSTPDSKIGEHSSLHRKGGDRGRQDSSPGSEGQVGTGLGNPLPMNSPIECVSPNALSSSQRASHGCRHSRDAHGPGRQLH
jgi:hypothetical protein